MSQTCRTAIPEAQTNTMRRYVSCLVNDIENHDVRSVLFARALAFLNQVCRVGPSAAGRRAMFNKLNGKPAIYKGLYDPRAS